MSEHHARLLGQIWRYLMSPAERLPHDWVASQVGRLDRTDGEIDALVQRIAHIRTWTYITHRPNWLEDSAHWQERTLAIEDKLSDALHDRLTQRFVDRRAASLVRYLAEARELFASVSASGEGAGRRALSRRDARLPLRAGCRGAGRIGAFPDGGRQSRAARRGRCAGERLAADADDAFKLDSSGGVAWQGEVVARLVPGERVLVPRVEVALGRFPRRCRARTGAQAARGNRFGYDPTALKPLFTALAIEAGGLRRAGCCSGWARR